MAIAKRAGRATANTRRIKHTDTKQDMNINQDVDINQDMDTKQDMAMQRWNKTRLRAKPRETDRWRP